MDHVEFPLRMRVRSRPIQARSALPLAPSGCTGVPPSPEGRHQGVLRRKDIGDLVLEGLVVAVGNHVHEQLLRPSKAHALDHLQDP